MIIHCDHCGRELEEGDALVMAEAPGRLGAGGRIFLFFGRSGDLGHVLALTGGAGFGRKEVAARHLAGEAGP